MEESLERELSRAKRQEIPVGILMTDIDYFKRFNDMFGHQAGDALLRELGIFFQNHIRNEDIACRYGGEEFIIILAGASLEMTVNRAEVLREQVKHIQVVHHSQVLRKISLSFGLSMFPDHGTTPEELIRAADTALYLAKKEGRDRVVVA